MATLNLTLADPNINGLVEVKAVFDEQRRQLDGEIMAARTRLRLDPSSYSPAAAAAAAHPLGSLNSPSEISELLGVFDPPSVGRTKLLDEANSITSPVDDVISYPVPFTSQVHMDGLKPTNLVQLAALDAATQYCAPSHPRNAPSRSERPA
jgi:hypothetical protein